jgi:BirA family biotin operon repressor/biotin-[acetyl-CoA-carboxylase] ligase
MDGGRHESPAEFEALASEFTGRPIGHTIVWRGQSESTMDDARRLAAAGAAEGIVAGADGQSAGRGRRGRGWYSRPGDDLLVSVVLRPPAGTAGRLSMMAGLAAARAVDLLTGRHATVKWPNDVRVDGRKICGVLIETAAEGPRFGAVAGFGLNVNLDPSAWPGLSTTATSLAHLAGAARSRVEALRALLDQFNELYGGELHGGGRGAGGDGDQLRRHWAERIDTLGQRVVLVAGNERVHGTAEGVDDEGGLVVRREDGVTAVYNAGEVTVQFPR